jgi:hypothetical protein
METESGRAWSYSLNLFLFQRCALTLAGLVAAIFFQPDNKPHIFLLPAQVYAPTTGWEYFLTSPWQRWDAEEYLAIASGGYSIHPALINFPPLYPALSGLLGRILFEHFLVAALLVSNLASIGALYFLYRLTSLHWDEKAARYTGLALICFPTAHFFLMPYSESLFLVLTLAAFYNLSKNRWWLGCLLAGLAGLARLQGVVLLLPIAYLFWQQHYLAKNIKNKLEAENQTLNQTSNLNKSWRENLVKDGLALFLVPLGFGLFELYTLVATASSNTIGGLNKFWGISLTWPGDTLFTAVSQLFFFQADQPFVPLYNAWGLFLLVLIGLTLWRGRFELPVSYQLYAWASILLYLTRKGESITTVSLERYLILIFPAFMYVGVMLSRKRLFYRRRLLLFSIGFLLQWGLAFGITFWFWTG